MQDLIGADFSKASEQLLATPGYAEVCRSTYNKVDICTSFPMFGEGVKQEDPAPLSFTRGFLSAPLPVLYPETLLAVSPTARQLGRIS